MLFEWFFSFVYRLFEACFLNQIGNEEKEENTPTGVTWIAFLLPILFWYVFIKVFNILAERKKIKDYVKFFWSLNIQNTLTLPKKSQACFESSFDKWESELLLTYSTDRTQPNTKADPESGPQVRFGSGTSPLFKNLRPLWVR